jgi:hypothetical protein
MNQANLFKSADSLFAGLHPCIIHQPPAPSFNPVPWTFKNVHALVQQLYALPLLQCNYPAGSCDMRAFLINQMLVLMV